MIAGRASYGAHLDNVDGDGRKDYGRCFTCIFYLNPSWDVAKHGGALRVFAPPANGDANGPPLGACEVAPTGGTVVIFRADQIVHEVMPALAERAALTVWMHAGTKEQAAKSGM